MKYFEIICDANIFKKKLIILIRKDLGIFLLIKYKWQHPNSL
jgi:hypothetical protein